MICEPPRTHDNKTRISSYTDPRTTYAQRAFSPTPIYIASPLVFLFPSTPLLKISPHANAPPPGHTCHGVATGPCMSHLHRLPPTTFTTLTCLSRSSLSLFATGFPVTPPEPGPVPSPASGFRPPGPQSPVSPGVPTGALNLGALALFPCLFSHLSPPQTTAPNLSFTSSPHAPSCFSRALPTDSHGSSASAAHHGTPGEYG